MLEPGDHMNALEFHRRYEEMPELKKAELLRGIVYTQPSVRFTLHAEPHAHLGGWLGVYSACTRNVECGNNCTVLLDDWNEPQPDLLAFVSAERGGRTKLVDGFVQGGPEFIAEVTTSSRSYDLGVKKGVYEEHGVMEYVVWRVADEAVDWFVLQDGRYIACDPDATHIYRSTIFPGLWLDWKALLTGDLARVFAVVQQGCATPEHAAFVERLAGK